MTHLLLCGMKNSGKTYWGNRLAHEISYPFIDLDRCLEEFYGKQMSCREIYQTVGEKQFRKLESEALLTLHEKPSSVIALGGGTPLEPLQKGGILIHLKADKEVLKQRTLSQKTLPAYFDPADPEGSFEKIYAERMPLYSRLAMHEIVLSGKKEEEILALLKEIAHGK